MSQQTTAAPQVRQASAHSVSARRTRAIHGQRRSFWLFVAPFLIGLAVFVYFPIIWSAF